MDKQSPSASERRSFLGHVNAGIASLAAMAFGSAGPAQAKRLDERHWEPARHDKDDWLEQKTARHRLVFDTTTPDGLGEALAFAANFIRVNGSEYGLQNKDLSVVIVVRHRSTPFAYSHAIWAKYGGPMAAESRFQDPKNRLAPTANVYNSEDFGESLPNRGVTLDSLSKEGVELAVCSVATRAYAGVIAKATGGSFPAINSELVASLAGGARMVPAGIVAVNRAQERGYTLVRA